MFNLTADGRLSAWAQHRAQLNDCVDPLMSVWEFWKDAPFIPYNHKIDQYHQASWPCPWEIIVENKYDDFTKALMIAWTLKLSHPFRNSKIDIKTYVDNVHNKQYNVVCIDDQQVINFDDNGPVSITQLLEEMLLENLIEFNNPR